MDHQGDIMEDRHVTQICSALKDISSAISYLAFAVIMSGLWQVCSTMGRH